MEKYCSAGYGNCTYKTFTSAGFGCNYGGFCNYQMPLGSEFYTIQNDSQIERIAIAVEKIVQILEKKD
jgi:hypothetical protein